MCSIQQSNIDEYPLQYPSSNSYSDPVANDWLWVQPTIPPAVPQNSDNYRCTIYYGSPYMASNNIPYSKGTVMCVSNNTMPPEVPHVAHEQLCTPYSAPCSAICSKAVAMGAPYNTSYHNKNMFMVITLWRSCELLLHMDISRVSWKQWTWSH